MVAYTRGAAAVCCCPPPSPTPPAPHTHTHTHAYTSLPINPACPGAYAALSGPVGALSSSCRAVCDLGPPPSPLTPYCRVTAHEHKARTHALPLPYGHPIAPPPLRPSADCPPPPGHVRPLTPGVVRGHRCGLAAASGASTPAAAAVAARVVPVGSVVNQAVARGARNQPLGRDHHRRPAFPSSYTSCPACRSSGGRRRRWGVCSSDNDMGNVVIMRSLAQWRPRPRGGGAMCVRVCACALGGRGGGRARAWAEQGRRRVRSTSSCRVPARIAWPCTRS